MISMISPATKTMLLPFCCSILAAQAFATPAKARQAKCLFEVGDKHYIGSICEFTPIDNKGSFRISDKGVSGIEAEVKVGSPGEGGQAGQMIRAHKFAKR
jgi:hypothetical protein